MAQPRRKDIRLAGFDYSNSACYFVTICCVQRRKMFGEIVDDRGIPAFQLDDPRDMMLRKCHVELTQERQICRDVLAASRSELKSIRVGEFVVMPNHVHLVVIANQWLGKRTSLGSFVRYLKSTITRAIHEIKLGSEVWQKGYHEHIIRDDDDYQRILEYIANNPAQWASDKYCA